MKEKSYSGLNVCQTDIFSNSYIFVFSFQGQVSELAQQGIKLTNYIIYTQHIKYIVFRL